MVNPVITYAVPAVNGFFKSIALSSGNSLQDTLRCVSVEKVLKVKEKLNIPTVFIAKVAKLLKRRVMLL